MLFDDVMVSTDKRVMMKVAKQYGATIPFVRTELPPKSLSKLEFMSNNGGIAMEEDFVHDIDSETDWKLAEMKYHLIVNNQGGSEFNSLVFCVSALNAA